MYLRRFSKKVKKVKNVKKAGAIVMTFGLPSPLRKPY